MAQSSQRIRATTAALTTPEIRDFANVLALVVHALCGISICTARALLAILRIRMQSPHSISMFRLLREQLRDSPILMSLSVFVVCAEELTGELAGLLPDVPVTILGAAIGIYVSFRTNCAYERWWEGRKLWGQLVNTSRHFCAQALAYLPHGQPSEGAQALVHNHIVYVHALRCELRGEAFATDADLTRTASSASGRVNLLASTLTTGILRDQLARLAHLEREHQLDPRKLQSLDQSLAVLLDVQGGCERIRNTPLPPSYGRIAELLIRTLAIILPLAIVDDLHWMALPVSIVICLAFKLMNEVGHALEDPFTRGRDALPLHALSLTIERNLREALAEPAPAAAIADGTGVLL